MAGTIWLIIEGQNDAEIVEAIVKHHYPHVHVEPLFPFGKNPNLSRLAAQIERLIKQALDNRQSGDCIAVLHDADLLSQPHDRAAYDHIQKACKRYRKDIRLVLAKDEIEAWLLADAGLCKWLQIKAQNCDEMKQPSLHLAALLDKAGKPNIVSIISANYCAI
jgi:hypothetical protein